jgi:hypothetical protein
MKAKIYFYALGQSARARGLSLREAEAVHGIDAGGWVARNYFDKGYRGLSL